MNMWKFAKIDFIKVSSQSKIMIIFPVIAFFIAMSAKMPIWAIGYMVFAGMILSTTPFFYEKLSYNGFFNLLPAKAADRMYGRYLYGTLFILGSLILGNALVGAIALINGEIPEYWAEMTVLMLSAGLIFNSAQFLILSIIKVKNAQILSIIRMVIPFAVFFALSAVVDKISDKSEIGYEDILGLINYITDYRLIIGIGLILFSIIFTVICSIISAAHETKLEA